MMLRDRSCSSRHLFVAIILGEATGQRHLAGLFSRDRSTAGQSRWV
jgi:hypothetical protein